MRVCTFVIVVFTFIHNGFVSLLFTFTCAHFFLLLNKQNFSLCYDKLPYGFGKRYFGCEKYKRNLNRAQYKKGKKISQSFNTLIIVPFTQDSAVVYSLTEEAKRERPVVKKQSVFSTTGHLGHGCQWWRKSHVFYCLSQSTHTIVLTTVPWSCQPKAFL